MLCLLHVLPAAPSGELSLFGHLLFALIDTHVSVVVKTLNDFTILKHCKGKYEKSLSPYTRKFLVSQVTSSHPHWPLNYAK